MQRGIDNGLTRVDRNWNFNQVNMVKGCLGNYQVYDVRFMRGSLVAMHTSLFRLSFVPSHDYTICGVRSINPCACSLVRQDIQELLDVGTIIVVHPRNLENNVNVIICGSMFPDPWKSRSIVATLQSRLWLFTYRAQLRTNPTKSYPINSRLP